MVIDDRNASDTRRVDISKPQSSSDQGITNLPKSKVGHAGAILDVHVVLGHTCHVHIVFLVDMRWQSAILGHT